MSNKVITPYCMSLQSVLSELSKYAVNLGGCKELGVVHTSNKDSSTVGLNLQGVNLTQDLNRLLLTPEFTTFMQRLESGIRLENVVVSRPHNVAIGQKAVQIAYEMASLALMLRNFCAMKEQAYAKNSTQFRIYDLLKNLSYKIHITGVKIIGHLTGNFSDIFHHFDNSMTYEMIRGTKDGK